jgi:RNA-directed DNA polymerase
VVSFDRVNHDKLMAKIAERVSDQRVLQLIRAFLRAGVMENGLVSPVDEGTPQGGDFTAERSGATMGTEVRNGCTTAFVGFSFTSEREPRRRIAPKAVLRFKEKTRELTRRTRGVKVEKMAEELGQYFRGWIGYFGQCQTPSVLQSLEEWTRRRLRSAIWKQWKRGSVRFAELRKRGVGRDLAAQTVGSAHGPWRLANSPALTRALPNAYFDSLGIPKLAGGR